MSVQMDIFTQLEKDLRANPDFLIKKTQDLLELGHPMLSDNQYLDNLFELQEVCSGFIREQLAKTDQKQDVNFGFADSRDQV